MGAGAVYLPSLSAPFVFDDLPGIVSNPTIRSLSSLGTVLLPEQTTGTSVVGRPIVNLSLALNYALGGLDPRGYRIFNVLVHVACGLALFGIVRRTLSLPKLSARFGADATPIALGVALLWMLHPLQTESVTGVIQRTELLAGFFYLLTLYGFIRSVSGPRPVRWQVVTIASCLLGMLTKEIVVSAPLVVLVFDRTFVAGSFREAFRRRTLWLGLGLCWIPLILLVAHGVGRGGTVGFGLGITAWEYLLTQCHALALYLKLSLWPHPLVLDYGMRVARGMRDVWPEALLLLVLLIAVAVALKRNPKLGFLGLWFFALLAPSSSFVPLATQTIAEHRMYLPLAAVLVLFVLALHACTGRRGLAGVAVLALALFSATVARNRDYRSSLSIWTDTVEKAPDNPRAHYNLANALSASGRAAEAIPHYETALRLQPGYVAAHYNLASAFAQLGRTTDAEFQYSAALRLDPNAPDVHANLAALLLRSGRFAEAVVHYEAARRLGPLTADEHALFGRALAEANRLPEAKTELEETLRLHPGHADAHLYLGTLLSVTGHSAEAVAHFSAVVRQRPEDFGARGALADTLVEIGRGREAIPHYEFVLHAHPNDRETRAALERARRGVR